MEANITTCKKCGYVRHWTGWKTGIGKTEAQLAQRVKDNNICIKCGGEAVTGLDHTSPEGKRADEVTDFAASIISGLF